MHHYFGLKSTSSLSELLSWTVWQSWRTGAVLSFTRRKSTACSCRFQGGQWAFAWAPRRGTRGKHNSFADYRKSTAAAEKRNCRKTRNGWKRCSLCRYTRSHAERGNAVLPPAHSDCPVPIRSCWRTDLWSCSTGVWWSSTWTRPRSFSLTSINSAWVWSSTSSWRPRFVHTDYIINRFNKTWFQWSVSVKSLLYSCTCCCMSSALRPVHIEWIETVFYI